ncbi:MAG: hypothetical protein JF593_09080 [Novosphingobium sp.]|nr:hypothetical protein [Novosphingobium sp.]
MIASWLCPTSVAGSAEEHAFVFDRGRPLRLLIVPALFDEANRLRRLTIEVMRRLDGAGIDSFLPDLPGCNESLQPLASQTPASWRAAMAAAAAEFGATHLLAMRGGALVAPDRLPGWRYVPLPGAAVLRQMLRTRILASREAGIAETQDGLLAKGLRDGLDLSGHALSARFLAELQKLEVPAAMRTSDIGQDLVGGAPLWLRAEPGEDRDQADALAAIIAVGMKA